MKFKINTYILILLFTLILSVSVVSASELENTSTISVYDEDTIESIVSVDYQDEINLEENTLQLSYQKNNSDMNYLQESSQNSLKSSNSKDVIVVNDWDELQYYCSQPDRDYTLKLKENTNFYPTDPHNPSYQIKIKNNVKIIGSEGAYIGDSSPNARDIRFVAFLVEDNSIYSLNFENVTFKYIWVVYSAMGAGGTRDGIFMQMGGMRTSALKNCIFHDVLSQYGHATIVYLKKGSATLDNCSFINCTSGYGAVSVYDPNSVKSTDMIVRNCYFENNYASTEPGCINNCGKLTVYNTTFVKNRSFWWAGAIHTHAGGNTTIYDSNFTDNVAGWNGGALYTYAYLQVYNSVFVGNNCTTNNGGGAIGACSYQTDPHIYIENCLFKDNNNNCWAADSLSDGTGRGGAISLMDAGSIEVRDTTFIANAAAQGTAICAYDVAAYGSPDIIIVNNNFINHTRSGDVLIVRVNGTVLNVSDNYFEGNSILFSNLTLTKLSEGKEQATLQVNASLTNPTYYDSDILNKTLYDVYINNKYVKTVNSSTFTVDFGDFDICDVYVIPTISNRKSNEVTITSAREYIFVSKSNGNDNNNGISRQTPVNTIKRALELAGTCQNIILLDGDYSEYNIQIDYDVTIKGEGNATLTNATSFISNSNFTLKNLKINNLNSNIFINQIKNSLSISHCIFTNNGGVLVNNGGFASIGNSILLNNSQIIMGDVNNIDVDYNWWGNAQPNLNINMFITLNITSDVESLENNHKANVNVNFYTNENQIYFNLPDIDLNILPINGIVSENIIKGNSQVVYALTAFEDGALSVNYDDFIATKSFEFLKSNPTISLTTNDVMVGDDVVIKINLPSDCEGNLTVNVGNISKTSIVSSPVFTFYDLKAGTYNVTIIYSGDKKYVSKSLTSSVNVNKYESTTLLSISEVNVGEDVLLTIRTTNSSTGTITLTINNSTQTLTLNNSKASYAIKNIQRGDYRITVVYSGDDKYLSSQDSKFIEVDNLNATMDIITQDIVYGETEIIKITLNDDATGEVSVTVDGVTNTSKLVNGKAELSFSNLNAGFKNITVFYSGDDTYFNLTESSNFTIDKADLTFNISSNNIKIGQVAEITIQVAPRTAGTFTIGSDILTIPMSGLVTYGIADLEIGDYTYTAVYNGDNYKTVSNSTSFVVSEYPIPQVPNNGLNPQNTHKSGYETSTNGDVAFIIPFNDTLIGDLVIDSLGNVYLTADNGIYCFNQTSRLWYWSSNTFEGNLSGISIGRDVVIAPKSGDTLYFINQTTGERYGGSNIYQGSSLFSPVVDSNVNLYIVSEYQYSSEDYKLVVIPYSLWEYGGDPTLVTIGNSKPLCSPTLNDDVIVVISDNRFRLINTKTLETISLKSGNFQAVRPVIGEGNIIYTVLSDSIVAYNSNGVQVWKTKVTGGVGNTLALDNEQGLYHVNTKGILYKYDLIGGSQSKVSDLKVTSGILVGADGTLYFGSNNLFYAMDSEGNVLWKSDLNSKIIGNPVMDKNGLIYVPTENGISALTYAPLKDPEFKIVADDIVEGEKATVTITWNNLTTGVVAVSVNGEDVSVDADDGKFTKIISGLEMGYHDISISYSGDMRFSETAMSKSFVVRSGGDVANNITFDGNSTFSFNLDNAKGNLTVKINDKIYTDVLVNGKASIIVNDLGPGVYEALAIYSGDDLYAGANRTFELSVPKFSVDLNESINTENVVANITVTLPVDATGNVTLSVGTKKYTQKLVDGNAVIVVDDLPAGNYSAVLSYSGDSNYESASKNIELKLVKIPVELNDDNLVIDSPSPTPGIAIQLDSQATGVLTVNVYGNEYSSNLVNGSANVIIDDLNPGIHSAEIIYSGDNKYSKASKTVQLEVPKINIKFNESNLIVDNLTVRVVLDSDASGKLSVIVADRQFSQDVERGIAEIKIEGVSPGTYNAVVVYSGDDKYVGTNKTVSITVPKIKSNLDNLTVKSDSISVDFGNDATGMITVTVNGKDFSTEVIDGVSNINITGLAPGNYSALVKYSGDNNYTNASKFVEIDVPKIEIGLDDVSVVASSDLTKIVVNLPVDATGTIVVKVNGKEYSANVIGGVLNINIAGLAPGNYSAIVTYSGDNNYTNASKIIDIKVPKIILEFNESTLSFEKHENNVTFTFNLPSNVTGDVIVSINGENYTATLRDGKAIIEVNDLRTGNYGALVKYVGDDNYEVIADTARFSVSMINVTLDDNNVIVENLTVNLKLNGDAEGNLTVIVGDKEFIKELVGGAASVDVVGLSPGTYTATVVYSGDDKYSIADKKVVLTVPKINSSLDNLTVQSDSVSVDFVNDATGILTVNINGKEYSAKVIDGIANVSIAGLSPGNYSAVVTYSGDNNYTNAFKSVSIEVPKIKINLNDVNVDINEDSVLISVSLPTDASGDVVVKVNGNEYSSNVFDGVSNINVTGLAPGNYNLTLTYSGDNNYTNASKSVSIEVPKIKINLDDVSVDVMENLVQVVVSLPVDASGVVVVKVNDKDYSSNVFDGVSNINITGLTPGNYSAVVTYSGDNNYTNASKFIGWEIPKVKVVLDNNTLVVNSTDNSLSCSISLPGDATGTLTVSVDGKEYSQRLVNGKATVTIPELSEGTHNVTVTYSGDGKYDSVSNSTIVECEPVKEVSNVTITVPDGVKVGESVKITVDIANASGNVTVIVDNKETVVSLVNGSASVLLDDISSGDHGVVVIYLGDETHAPVHAASSFSVAALPEKVDSGFVDISIIDRVFTLVLKDANGNAISGANVSYAVNGASSSTITGGDGSFSIIGDYGVVISVDYAGDDMYHPTNIVIKFDKMPSVVRQSTVIVGSNFTQYALDYSSGERGQNFTVQLKDANGNVLANKTVLIGYNGKTLYRTTDADGYASVQINLRDANRLTFAVTFLGDEDYNATMSVYLVTVNKKPVTITAAAKTYKSTAKTKKYTVTLKTIKGSSVDGKTYFGAGKKVVLKINGKTYSAKTNAKGQATFSLKITKKGKYSAFISYAGDNTYKSTTKTVKINIK